MRLFGILAMILLIGGCSSIAQVRDAAGHANDVAIEPAVFQVMIAMTPRSVERICPGVEQIRLGVRPSAAATRNAEVLALDPRITADYQACYPGQHQDPKLMAITYMAGVDDALRLATPRKIPPDTYGVLDDWQAAGYVTVGGRFDYCGGHTYLFAIQQGDRGPQVVDKIDVGRDCWE